MGRYGNYKSKLINPQKINEILSDDHIKSIKEMSYHIAVVQKLNEELTAENARLLEELEKSKPFTALENNLPVLLSEIELISIKSKWWYRLFKFLGL